MGYRTNKLKGKEKSCKANNYTEFFYHFFPMHPDPFINLSFSVQDFTFLLCPENRLPYNVSVCFTVSDPFLPKSFFQHRIPFCHSQVPDRIAKRFPRSNNHHDLFRPGNTCIDQVPLEHHKVAHQYRHHNNRVFRALCLVDCRRISEDQLVQLRNIILYAPVIE